MNVGIINNMKTLCPAVASSLTRCGDGETEI